MTPLSSLFRTPAEVPAEFSWSPATDASIFSPIQLKVEGKLKAVPLGSIPNMTAREGLEILEKGVNAYNHGRGPWADASYKDRIKAVLAFASDLEAIEKQVALAIMWEIAKPWNDSLAEVRRTVDYIRETCEAYEAACKGENNGIVEKGFFAQTRRVPLGMVLCMGPFNYPLNETYTTLIPALLAGNSVLLKPAKWGVLLHLPILPLFKKHFPAGTVGMLFGDGKELVTPIMISGHIDALAFIGSSGVANAICSNHPKPNRMRSILGLEAKNAAIICADADIEAAVEEVVQGALTFNGQRCTALKMILPHKSIAAKFKERLAEKVDALKLGMPWEPGVQITPVAEPNKVAALEALKADAVANGAKWLNPFAEFALGNLYRPAILDHVSDKAKLSQVEQFGPIIPIREFSDIREPLTYVENSQYGQQASVFGNGREAAFLVDSLTKLVARVNINTQCRRGPDTFAFGGRKDSAAGTLSVRDALRCFSIRSVVSFKCKSSGQENGQIDQLVKAGNKFLSNI